VVEEARNGETAQRRAVTEEKPLFIASTLSEDADQALDDLA